MTEDRVGHSGDEPNAGSSESGLSAAPKFQTDRSHYEAALRRWMEGALRGARDVSIEDMEIPRATGFSNETVMFDTAWTSQGRRQRKRFVARVEPYDGGMFPLQTPQCAVSVEVQCKAMSVIADAGLPATPIPPIVGYEPDPGVLGRPFFVMEFVTGRVAPDVPRYTQSGFVAEEATPEQRRRMVLAGIEAMAGVHSLDWRSPALEWLDPSNGAGPSVGLQIGLYRRAAVVELAGREHPVLFAALDWLAANDPGDERFGFTWGDARIGNVIWQDYRPAAVLDWEACALSPTEADMGWWLMFDRMSFDDLGIERLEGYPTRSEMIEHYERVSGREVRDPHYWEVFGAMRFCHIFIRLGDRMTDVGMIPPEMNPAVGNQVTEALAVMLGIHNPTPDKLARPA